MSSCNVIQIQLFQLCCFTIVSTSSKQYVCLIITACYNLARPVRLVSSLNAISFGSMAAGPVRGLMPAALYTASITPAPIDHEGQVVMVHLHLSERVWLGYRSSHPFGGRVQVQYWRSWPRPLQVRSALDARASRKQGSCNRTSRTPQSPQFHRSAPETSCAWRRERWYVILMQWWV